MTKAQIEKIAKNKKITHCYIMKQGSYYRPNAAGYTIMTTHAGVYPKGEALLHASSCEEIVLIPIIIGKHNALILDEVNELLSRIICE